MYCSYCGMEIVPGDAALDTRIVPGRNPKFPYGRYSRIEPLWLCEDCAKSREKVKRTLLWTMVLFFVGLIAIAIVGGVIASLR